MGLGLPFSLVILMLALGFGCIHKVCILHIANYSQTRLSFMGLREFDF